VPRDADLLLKKRSISSSDCVRWKCCVGRRTAIEPPWLTRVEFPVHILEPGWLVGCVDDSCRLHDDKESGEFESIGGMGVVG
jgi:hypothetical protein